MSTCCVRAVHDGSAWGMRVLRVCVAVCVVLLLGYTRSEERVELGWVYFLGAPAVGITVDLQSIFAAGREAGIVCPLRAHTSLAYGPASGQPGSQSPPRRTRGSGPVWRDWPGDSSSSLLCPFLNPGLQGLPSLEGLLPPEDLRDSGNLAKQEGKNADTCHCCTRSGLC